MELTPEKRAECEQRIATLEARVATLSESLSADGRVTTAFRNLQAENAKLRAEVELVLFDDGTTGTRADAWKREYEKMRRERDDLREQLRLAVAESEATS